MRNIAEGDHAAFAALHRKHHAKVFRFVVRMVQASDRAEEVTNDTMVAVWKNASRFEFRSKVSTWIFGIAYRTALKSLRRFRFERAHVDIENMPEIEDTNAASGDAIFAREQIGRALKTLPTELRAVVELTYFLGLSYPEISEVLRCPVGTVKSRMHTARTKLREVLE
ncbi:MAG: sigma-70 family RNA polymerase sigma factor [Pseudomonadota bacterium]